MTYSETLEYIHSVSWRGSRPGLERITELLKRLGDPQKGLKVVHVAGTNGKGSFCAMLASVLMSSGYSVGTFTSPYVEDFCERITFDGENIPKKTLCAIVSRVRPHADAMADPPTEFELITAIGFEFFSRMRPDVVIVECGMGGRLDSTNVVPDPLLSVITGVSLDHTAILGDTVEKIAFEKAGIIKPGRPVLFGGDDPKAAAVIKEQAKKLGSPCYTTDRSMLKIKSMDTSGTVFDFGPQKNLKISLAGTYQPLNAANVIYASAIIYSSGLKVSEKALAEGLEKARWKARFERMSSKFPVWFDGGHNPEGVAAALETVKAFFKDEKIVFITGVMADKDHDAMARLIAPAAKKVFTVAPDNPRALPAAEYAAQFESLGAEAKSCADYTEALTLALACGSPVLALGSLYAYADFKKALRRVEKLFPAKGSDSR
ncbi:MAG: bifunctional folylpolyglutamate synthase/dihydrofolate synthase [Clostridia bacterium]|nr:bifunctional folylpolyglutamate synthase/dihydrofolate synthase [Clostridia bacterium]